MLQRDIWQSVLVHLTTHPPHDKGIWPGSQRANKIAASYLGFLPLVLVVDLIGVGDLLNVENVLLAGFLLFFLFEGGEFRVLTSVLPVVDGILTSYDNVRFVHSDEFGFNSDELIVNGASDCIA